MFNFVKHIATTSTDENILQTTAPVRSVKDARATTKRPSGHKAERRRGSYLGDKPAWPHDRYRTQRIKKQRRTNASSEEKGLFYDGLCPMRSG